MLALNAKDLTGQKFGKLKVIKDSGERQRNGKRILWECECECGNVKEINMRKVREMRTLSCGCYIRKYPSTATHGLSGHTLYGVWQKIKARCYNKANPAYGRYGGIGVVMCDEWVNDAPKFIEWALNNGWRKGLEIDKDIIPKELGIDSRIYSPEMCKIVTRKDNCNARISNVILTFNGKSQNIKRWSEELGISPSLIRTRISVMMWTPEDALSIRPNNKFSGRPKTIK